MLLPSSKRNTEHYSYKNTLQISVQIYFPCLHVMDLRHRGIVFPKSTMIGKCLPQVLVFLLWICVVGQHPCLWWEMGTSLSFTHNLKKKKSNQNQNPCYHDDYLGVFHHLETTALLFWGLFFVIVVLENLQQTQGKTLSGSILQMPLRWRGWFSFLALCHSVSWAAVSHVYSSHGWR